MNARSVITTFALSVSVISLGACKKKQPETAPAPVQTTPTDDAAARQRAADSIANVRRQQQIADSIAAARANSGDAEKVRTEVVNTLAQKVYFDYDQDVLRDDARAVLDGKAAVLNANPAITLVITGHTDERGTAEYNLALGQRRAAQVKRYLVSKGIAENRLATQSLGDSQPAAQGTDESAYQLNRRAEFEAMNVSGTLVRPRS